MKYKNKVLKFLVTIILSISFSLVTLAETAFDACLATSEGTVKICSQARDAEGFKACYATSQGTAAICVNTRNAEAFRACYATAEGTAEICSRAR